MPYGKSVPVPKGWSMSMSTDSKAKAEARVKELKAKGYTAKVVSGIAYTWSGAAYPEYLAVYRAKRSRTSK